MRGSEDTGTPLVHVQNRLKAYRDPFVTLRWIVQTLINPCSIAARNACVRFLAHSLVNRLLT